MSDKKEIAKLLQKVNKEAASRRKKAGLESEKPLVFLASDDESFGTYERIPSGIMAFDTISGGGVPRGLITQIAGPEGGGKSTIVANIIAQAQKMGLSCAYVDAEHRADKSWMEKQGVIWNDLTVLRPAYAEESLTAVTRFCESGLFGLVAMDSIVANATLGQKDKHLDGHTIGELARRMAEWLPIVNPVNSDTNTALVMTNQMRAKITSYGAVQDTPCGNTLKHYISLWVQVRRGSITNLARFKEGTKEIGFPMICKIKKTSIGDPNMEATSDFYFGQGFDSVMDTFNLAVQAGKLTTSGGGIFYFEGEKLEARGLNKVVDLIRNNEELLNTIKASVNDEEPIHEESDGEASEEVTT